MPSFRECILGGVTPNVGFPPRHSPLCEIWSFNLLEEKYFTPTRLESVCWGHIFSFYLNAWGFSFSFVAVFSLSWSSFAGSSEIVLGSMCLSVFSNPQPVTTQLLVLYCNILGCILTELPTSRLLLFPLGMILLYCSFFKVYFIDYAITVVPFLSPLYSPPPCVLPPTCIPPLPLSSCPWIIHTSSLASPFPILFLTSLCLFCTYHLCFLFPVLILPFILLPPTPTDDPQCDLHFCDSVSVLIVCLVSFLFLFLSFQFNWW